MIDQIEEISKYYEMYAKGKVEYGEMLVKVKAGMASTPGRPNKSTRTNKSGGTSRREPSNVQQGPILQIPSQNPSQLSPSGSSFKKPGIDMVSSVPAMQVPDLGLKQKQQQEEILR